MGTCHVFFLFLPNQSQELGGTVVSSRRGNSSLFENPERFKIEVDHGIAGHARPNPRQPQFLANGEELPIDFSSPNHIAPSTPLQIGLGGLLRCAGDFDALGAPVAIARDDDGSPSR